MNNQILGALLLATGSFLLGYLTAWHMWSTRFQKLKYALKMWNGLVLMYKEHMDSISIPPKAKAHMERATKIHDSMKSLMYQIEMPSKSASHSLYKNDLRKKLMELNSQRLKELSSAVEEGYNPNIEYKGQIVRMSDVIAEQIQELEENNETGKQQNKNKKQDSTKPSKPRHLHVIKE